MSRCQRGRIQRCSPERPGDGPLQRGRGRQPQGRRRAPKNGSPAPRIHVEGKTGKHGPLTFSRAEAAEVKDKRDRVSRGAYRVAASARTHGGPRVTTCRLTWPARGRADVRRPRTALAQARRSLRERDHSR